VFLVGNFDGTTSQHCFLDAPAASRSQCSAQGGVDLTQRFHNLLLSGFVISLFAWIGILWTTLKYQLMGAKAFILLDLPLSLIWIGVLSSQRFSHSGRVVSGDYCAGACFPENGYMVSTGDFFKKWLYLLYSFWAISFVFVALRLYTMNKKSASELPLSPKLNKAYVAKYERVGSKPLGAGLSATAWKIKLKGDDGGQFFVGKELAGLFEDKSKILFSTECNALKQVDHPGCVHLCESFGDGGSGSVMVLDFLDGRDLSKVLQCEYTDKGVERDQLINWCLQMAEAVRYLHEELYIVHKDLHPGNWMVLQDGAIKLIDFGFALCLGQDGVSKDMWVYDPFMSPEVMEEQPAGFDADLWCLSATLYTIVHPQHFPPWQSTPFSFGKLQTIVHCLTIRNKLKSKVPCPQLPKEVGEYNQLFERCFDYDLAKRPSINEIIAILKRIQGNYCAK
jgi:serine/threonine protein kinase